jgi:NTE family protein
MDEIQKQIKILQEKLKDFIKTEKVIKNLVLSGGSSKGFSYIGVIKVLEEFNIIETLEEIMGTSIGGIFGLFIILNFNSDDLINIFIKMNLNWLHNINSDSILHLINKYGLDNGSNAEKFIASFIEVRFPLKNPFEITFLDLWNYNPIKFNLIGTKVYTGILDSEIYNHILTPNMPIIKALRITFGIPPLFSPIDSDSCHLVDGGITNNYPIDLYDNSDNVLENTLGILCLEKIQKEKCKNVVDIYKSIVGHLVAKDTLKKKEQYSAQTVIIEVNLELYQIFNLTTEDKINVINLGYQLTKQFLIFKEYTQKDNQSVEKIKKYTINKINVDNFVTKLESIIGKKPQDKNQSNQSNQ